jgi:hypothetical protein
MLESSFDLLDCHHALLRVLGFLVLTGDHHAISTTANCVMNIMITLLSWLVTLLDDEL